MINSPPTEFSSFYGRIESNTQVNLYPGGTLPSSYTLGPSSQPANNIEINLLGGMIGSEERPFGRLSSSQRVRTTDLTINLIEGTVWGDIRGSAGALVTMEGATMNGKLGVTDGSLALVTGGKILKGLSASDGSMVQMSDGIIGSNPWSNFDGAGAYSGSVFLMTNGVVNGGFVVDDSYASLSGGRVEGEVHVSNNGQIDITGGSLGPIHTTNRGVATLSGGEFQLNGAPLDDLTSYSQSIDFPEESLLTGVLSDGTPVTLSNSGYLHDYFQDNRINLRLAPPPPSEPRAFDAPGDAVPSGLRTGQSLTLRPDGFAPANFTTLPGSTISVEGGSIDHGFEATGAAVTLSTGNIGDQAAVYRGTMFHVSGGSVGSNFEAGPGSHIEVSGGKIGDLFVAHLDSEVTYSGGQFGSWLQAKPGSSFTIAGGDFRINGAPISALASLGAGQKIDLPELGVLSGTLTDGSTFAFSADSQFFAPGTLLLQAAEIPAIGPSVIRLPSDPVPQGLRSGQTLFLADGGEVGDQFTADWGSFVRMSGGHIGNRFQAVGGFVNINGGTVGSINALVGSVVNLAGGEVEHQVTAHRGAIINLSAGEIAGDMNASFGGRVNITGGTVRGYSYATNQSAINISGGIIQQDISLSEDSSLALAGGEIFGEIHAWGGSQVNLSGGRLADGLSIDVGGQAKAYGTDMRIDGEPIDEELLGSLVAIDLPTGSVLSGVFADGTPFAFASSDGDWFAPGTLQVSSSQWHFAQLPITIHWPPLGFIPPRGLLPGKELTLHAGEVVDANFTAGWGSELTIAGGEIGQNFEAVGAQVTLQSGAIGNHMDVFFGTELSVTGGTIGRGLEAHQGSVVNISGGLMRDITARSGSSINITGGFFGELIEDEFYSGGRIALETGSELHLTGSDLLLNGGPIEGLVPGSSVVLQWEDQPYIDFALTGRLLDGSPFSAVISSYPWSNPADWQFGDLPTITLTAALPGDFDGNQLVDAADLAIWQTQYGQTTTGSTLRNGDDFLNWQRGFGTRAGFLTDAQVPEPGSWQVLAIMVLWIIATGGCTFSRSGSQSISFDTDAIGTGRQALIPADGYGYHNGEKLDHRE